MKKPLGTSLVTLAALALSACAFAGSASAASSCSLVASPSGSDAAAGSVAAPFQSVQKLVDSLQPGQSGCLRAGTFRQDVRIGNPQIVLTSYPGESATLVGRLWVARGADGTSVTNLRLDGSNVLRLPSPSVAANYITFSGDDVSNNHSAICFDLGSDVYGTAAHTLITRNRIHDCGVLPAMNHQHGIYVQAASYTSITWNLIDHNADRGIQLYPSAQYTTIAHNIIDHNGSAIAFGGDSGVASNNTSVYDNVLSNATMRYDAESYYPAGTPAGIGNVVSNNCIWAGKLGTISMAGGGFSESNNTIAAPQFTDAENHNYTMNAASPCLALVGDVQATVYGTTATIPIATAPVATAKTSGASATSHPFRAHAAQQQHTANHRRHHHHHNQR